MWVRRPKSLCVMHDCTFSIHPVYVAADSHGPATDIKVSVVPYPPCRGPPGPPHGSETPRATIPNENLAGWL